MSLLNMLGGMATGLIADRAAKYSNPMLENLFSQNPPAPIEDRSTQAIPAQMQDAVTVGLDPYASMPPVSGYDMPPMPIGGMEMNLPAIGGPEDDVGILAAQYDLNPDFVQSAMAEGMTIPDLRESAQLSDALYDGQRKLANIKVKKAKGEDTSEDESMLSKIGGGLKSFFGNEEAMLGMALAFNTLRNKPDNQLAAGVQDRLKTIRENKLTVGTSQQVISYLQNKGYTQLAKIVANDPKQAKDVLKQVMQKEMKSDLGQQSFAAKVDEKTGRMYIQKFDPNTGKTSVEYLDGVKGQTAAEKTKMELGAKEKERDTKFAQDMSANLVEKADNIGSQIRNLEEVDKQLAAGASTGTFENLFPSLRKSTLALENAVNRLGLDVIGGTTFGALSAEELRMALRTAVPTGMDEDALRDWVREKIRVQRLLEIELLNSARKLSGGMGWSDWIKERDEAARAAQEARKAAEDKKGQTKPVDENLTPVQKAMKDRGLLKDRKLL
jgi:hypothetical protein